MSIKVYLAAPYAKRDSIRDLVLPDLAKVDATHTSSWLEEEHEITDGTIGAATDLDDMAVSGHALVDFYDIDRSDVFVLFTADWFGYEGPSSGRHVETGYALAKGKHVIVLGEPENIFHRISTGQIEMVDDWNSVLLAIQRFEIHQLRETLDEVAP